MILTESACERVFFKEYQPLLGKRLPRPEQSLIRGVQLHGLCFAHFVPSSWEYVGHVGAYGRMGGRCVPRHCAVLFWTSQKTTAHSSACGRTNRRSFVSHLE